ncbi:MAG: hypothetical protein WD063_19105 [Pirellulales bacterium]
MSKWKFTVEAQSPGNPRQTWITGFSERQLALLLSKGHKEKLAKARLAEEVLEHPESIIKGWGRDKADSWIYVGAPPHDYRSDSIETPPPKGKRSLVFVLPDGTIDDWVWRDARTDEPGLPDGMKGNVVWPVN